MEQQLVRLTWVRLATVSFTLAAATFIGVFFGRLHPAPPFAIETLALIASGAAVIAVALSLAVGMRERRNTADRLTGARRKTQTILDRVGDGVVVTDTCGRIVDCNDAAGRLLGGHTERPVGRSCAQALGLHQGDQRLDCSGGCALLAADRDEALGVEAWRYTSDERRQPLLVNVARVPHTSGHGHEVVHSLRDITQLKQAEEAKTLFVATTSHELKTPLTVVQGFAELLLERRYQTDTHHDYALQAIVTRAAQLSRLIDRLLLTSRIEAGRTSLQLQAVEAFSLLTERAEALATAQGRKIDIDIPHELPPIHTDPGALETVLDHLLDNAAKYSPNGDPITLTVRVNAETVTIAVSDRGIGMTTEQLERCFEKFWQGESTEGRRFGGSGIGLYIVRSLVDAMHGKISVTSVPGTGTTFCVELRRADIVSPDELTIEAPEPGVADRSTVKEFMRQIGITEGSRS